MNVSQNNKNKNNLEIIFEKKKDFNILKFYKKKKEKEELLNISKSYPWQDEKEEVCHFIVKL